MYTVRMIKKALILSLFVIFSMGGGVVPAKADDSVQIDRAENYLRSLHTLKADFIQTAYNGSRLSGTFYLNRPGKLRFNYNEVDDFIVADGLFIYFYDAELKEQTNAPIGQTLADFLLREDISLRGDVTIQNIEEETDFQVITIAEAEDPAAGSVKLYFSKEPYALKKWEVIDAAGLTTEITLQNIERDINLPSNLFVYIKPRDDKPSYNR